MENDSLEGTEYGRVGGAYQKRLPEKTRTKHGSQISSRAEWVACESNSWQEGVGVIMSIKTNFVLSHTRFHAPHWASQEGA